MTLSAEVVQEILHEYKRTRSPFKVAKLLGFETTKVWEVIDANAESFSSYQERNGGWGNPALIKFIVARRLITSRQWDNDSPKIANARARYELGTHDMATGRDGSWLILYSFPLKRMQPRTNYFKPEVV